MAPCTQLHPVNPQSRLIAQAGDALRRGALLIYPTDSCYALGCCLRAKDAQDRLRHIRQLDIQHDLSLLFADLSQLSEYLKLDDRVYRLLRGLLPGPYTVILPATHDVPRRLADGKRRSIGARIPDSAICRALLTELGEPLMSSTLHLPGDDLPLHDPEVICARMEKRVDGILLGGEGSTICSTVLDCTVWPPQILREGLGDGTALRAALGL